MKWSWRGAQTDRLRLQRHALKWKQNKHDIKGKQQTQWKLEIHIEVRVHGDVKCESKEVAQDENAPGASCSQKDLDYLPYKHQSRFLTFHLNSRSWPFMVHKSALSLDSFQPPL